VHPSPAPSSSPDLLRGGGEWDEMAGSSSISNEEGELLGSLGSTDLVLAVHFPLQRAFSQI
jgi:hypothetical protein